MNTIITREDIRCENNIGCFTGEQSYYCYAIGKHGEWHSCYYFGCDSEKEAMDTFYDDVNKGET